MVSESDIHIAARYNCVVLISFLLLPSSPDLLLRGDKPRGSGRKKQVKGEADENGDFK
jgi:hypothetical protein